MRCLFTLLLACFAVSAAVKTDIEYGTAAGVSLKLDASIPNGPGPFPAAILVHGGGWTKGDKATFVKPLFEPLSNAGYAWFSINYRLAPAYHLPDMVSDIETAIRYVKAHAAEYKVDPNRIALIGESAGGHLVGLVGAENKPDVGMAAIVPFYGPHNLLMRAENSATLPPGMVALLGIPADTNREDALAALRAASPIAYVRKGLPPFLLIHGTADPLVPYEQSVKMCEAIRKAGNECKLITVEGAGHGIGGWEKNPAFQAYKAGMISWLNEKMVAK
jgi:acetyl esterase